MPKIGTKSQKEIFKELKRYFKQKGYKYLGWNGKNDDSHRFGTPKTSRKGQKIYCYVQFISVKATKRPRGSVGVFVRQNERNKNMIEFSSGNGFFGQGDRHIFIIPVDNALRLIDTI